MSIIEEAKKRQIQTLKNRGIGGSNASNTLAVAKQRQVAFLQQREAAKIYQEAQTAQKKLDYYNSLKNNADWEELSQKSAAEASYSRDHYNFSKGSENFHKFLDHYIYGIGANAIKKAISGNEKSYHDEYNQMTDDQKAILNYLTHTDRDKADEYFDDLKQGLEEKALFAQQEKIKDFGNEHKVLGSLASVGTNFLSITDGVENIVEGAENAILGKGFTYDTKDDKFTHATTALREGASEDMSGVGKFLYGTGMSLLDNIARAPFGPVGAGALAMGQAASNAIVQGKEMGMADWKAALYGISVGAIEGLTEKYSVDTLLDKTQLAKSVKGYILKNVIAEGSEEAVSELADKVVQQILAGDEAEWRKEYDYYISQGKSKSAAIGLVIANTAGDVGLASLSGAISGGAMGGGSVGINSVRNVAGNISKGKEITAAGHGTESDLISAAQALGSEKVNKTVDKLNSLNGTDKTLRQDYQRGKLYQQVFSEAYEKLHPYGDETETKKNGKPTHDAKVAIKKLNKENEQRQKDGKLSIAEEFEQSEFGKKYNALETKLKDYNSTQSTKDAEVALSKKQSPYETSLDGKTYITETDSEGNAIKDADGSPKTKEVEISDVVGVSGGIVQVKLSDGSVVPANKLLLPEKTAKAYTHAASHNDIATAKAFLKGLEGYEGSIEQYAEGFETAYSLGLESNTRELTEMVETLPKSKRDAIIKHPAVAEAFSAGKRFTKKANEDAAKMKKDRDAKKSRSRGKFSIDKSIDTSKLSSKQKKFIRLAKLFSKCFTDLNVRIVNSKPDANGEYHKENGSYNVRTNTIEININAGKVKEGGFFDYLLNETLSHETVHYIKAYSLSDYNALKAFLQKHVYTSVQWNNLVLKRLNEYYNGDPDCYNDAEEEVVANGCQTMFNSPRVLYALAKNNLKLFEKIKFRVNAFFDTLIRKLGDHVNYTVEARAVMQSAEKTQKELEKKFIEALRNAKNNTETSGEAKTDETGSIKYSYKGRARDGKGIYESNFPKGTPKSAKSQKILDYLINVWSKNPIKLVISNGETSRTIFAQFDPTVDTSQNIPTDASKLAGGNRHGNHTEQRVTLDLADDYYQIASEAVYNYSKEETGKDADTHIGVKMWHYFVNDIYFAEHGETKLTPYTVTINVKEKADGNFVYSFNAERTKEFSTRQTLHAAVNARKGANGELFIDSIPETYEKSNSFSKNSLEKYSNLEKDEIDNYTEEQYNNFGWARANGVLSARENERLRSLFADAVSKQSNPPKTKSGEYMIAIGEDVDNKIAYMTGEIDNPVITRVLKIDEYNETKLSEIRSHLYALERKGIRQTTRGLFTRYTVADFGNNGDVQRGVVQNAGYNNQLGVERGRGGKTTSRVKEILFDDDGNEISRSYRKESKLERDEITVRDMLATNLEELTVTKTEKKRIAEYRGKLDEQSECLEKIDKLRDELNNIKNRKGDRDIELRKKDIRAEIKALQYKIAGLDSELLKLQNLRSLRNVVKRTAERLVEKSHFSDEMYYYRKLAEKDRQHQGQIRSLKAKHVENMAKEVAKREQEQQQHKDELRRIREEHKEKVEYKVIKAKIEKLYNKMMGMIKRPDDKHYVPHQLLGPLANVLELLDFDTDYFEKTGRGEKIKIKRKELRDALRKLARSYENEVGKNEDFDILSEYEEEYKAYFERLADILDDRKVSELDIETLAEVAEILQEIDQALSDAKKLIDYEYGTEIREVVDTLVKEQLEVIHTNKRKPDAELNRLTRLVRTMGDKALTPMQIVEELSGHLEDAQLKRLFEAFAKGTQERDWFYMQSHKMFEELTTGENLKKYQDSQSKKIEIGIQDVDGKPVVFTKQLIMQVILSVERERAAGNMNHIFSQSGGINIPNAKALAKGKIEEAKRLKQRIILNDNMLEQMYARLDEWDKQYMELSREFFNKVARDKINEVARKVKHRDIATSDAYIPFEVDKDYVPTEVGDNLDTILQQTISSYGMLKNVSPNAQQPINIMGLDVVLEKHIDMVAKFAGYAVPVKNFNKVWNSRIEINGALTTVRAFMNKYLGESAVKHVTQAIKDLQGERISDENGFLKAVNNHFVTSALTFNFSTVLKQFSSLPNGFAVLKNRKAGALGAYGRWIATAANYESIIAEIDEHSAAHYKRRLGLSTNELGDFSTKMGSTKKLMEKLGFTIPGTDVRISAASVAELIQKVDCITAATFWHYAKLDITDSGQYEQGSEKYWKAVTELYEKTLNETQSTYDVLNRPEYLKTTNQAVRMLTLFQTETFKQAGMLRHAIGKLAAAKKSGDSARISGARRELAKTVYALLRSMLALLITTTIGKFLYHRLKDYTNEDGVISASKFFGASGMILLESVAGLIVPVIGSGFVRAIEGIATKKYFYSSEIFTAPSFDFLNDWIYSLSALSTGFTFDKVMTAINSTLEVFFGLPAQNLWNLVEAIKEWVQTILDS